MSAVTYETADIPAQEELLNLYNAVGWSAYTKDPARLAAAVRASLAVVTARQDGELSASPVSSATVSRSSTCKTSWSHLPTNVAASDANSFSASSPLTVTCARRC